MLSRETKTNLFLLLSLPAAIAAIMWAVNGIAWERVDAGLITLAALTVFCSCYLRIQLPRVNIHVTISDGLVILAMLIYGGEAAVLIAVIETTFAAMHMYRKGVTIQPKTILANILIAAMAVFSASKVVSIIFGPTELVLQRNDFTSFVWLLAVMTLTMFTVNSVLVAVLTSVKNDRSFWAVWSENCANALIMYATGGIVAGLIVKALEQINFLLFAAIIAFFGIIFLTFRRFVDDVSKTVDKAKEAERERAEQAEQHVVELKHYVAELERSGEALQESHENFRHAAYHDGLTGLPNRNYFIDTLKGLLQQCREDSESNFAVLFLDLKSFKTINDSLGHSLGDRLIRKVGKRLSGMVRDVDLVGRFGGDKFGIILSDLLSMDEATGFADRLAKRLAEPYTLEGRQVFTSAKIGIAYGNSKYPEAEDILRDADIAMYYAKDNEENYVIFDQKMHIRT